MLRFENKKKKKKKKINKKKIKNKKDLVATGFEPRTPAWVSNVTTTASADYVFIK